ncbi:MAG: deoxyribonuclease IV [Desulfobulbaceae bacterium]|nr:deoxyribonuclease IV [Desulfobulbaceae bacterium]
MPRIGAHMSIAGGLHKAFDRISEVGGDALQIFTKNQRQWRSKPLTTQEITTFTEKRDLCGEITVAAHASYLINLAAAPGATADKSLPAFVDELQRCDQLSIPYLVIHPGSHGGAGIETGIERVVSMTDKAFAMLPESSRVMLLLETTAGQGTALGARFDELGTIISKLKHSQRVGVCVDTCHIFAAGYDIRTPATYKNTVSELNKKIGLNRVHFFHLNDSKKELGSKVDRHEHIGQGKIGTEGFRCLLNDPRFAQLPMSLETPKSDNMAEDKENLNLLRSLIKK